MKDDGFEPSPIAKPSWTSLYFGVGGGYGSSNTEVSGDAGGAGGGSLDGIGADGGFVTFQVGADYQVSQRFVVGAFFDYDLTDLSSDLSLTFGALGINGEAEFEDVWTVGVRAGYLINPHTLFYVGAGYTETSLEGEIGVVGGPSLSGDLGDFSGYALLAGMEAKLSENFSLKAEYRFTQYDNEEVLSIGGVDIDAEPSIHAGRLVGTYRFNLMAGRH